MSRLRIKIIAIAAGLLVAALIAVALLLGPADADGRTDGPPVTGCAETTTREIYVQRAYDCPDGTRVVIFADDGARDAYLDAAQRFGTRVIERGPAWARVQI